MPGPRRVKRRKITNNDDDAQNTDDHCRRTDGVRDVLKMPLDGASATKMVSSALEDPPLSSVTVNTTIHDSRPSRFGR